jgi:hypothetical protein
MAFEKGRIVHVHDHERRRPFSWSTAIAGSLAGVVAFPATLAGFQRFVFKPLRLTSSLSVPFVSSVLGAGAVLAGSAVATLSVASAASVFSHYKTNVNDLYVSTAGGVVLFKVFGGRFRSVLPSHLLRPGSFAVSSLPARGKSYVRAQEKDVIGVLGKQNGCHTCGKRSGQFVADHQPPNHLSIPGQLQRFYPQCRSCSNRQGGLLASVKSSSLFSHPHGIVTHGSALRLYHLFLPLPLIIPLLKTSASTASAHGDSSGSVHRQNEDSTSFAAASSSGGGHSGASKRHVGTQTDFADISSWNGDDDDDDISEYLSPIEQIPRKLYQCVRAYLGLFPGDVGQMYALFHVCLVVAALSNLVI